MAGGNSFGQGRVADPTSGPCSVRAAGRSPLWTRGSRTSTATQAAMNEERLAPSKYSIRTSSGPSAGVVRDAHRPLLVWRKHKLCLNRQANAIRVLGIANCAANPGVFARVLWRVEGGDVRAGTMVCQICTPQVTQNITGTRERLSGGRIHGCARHAVAA